MEDEQKWVYFGVYLGVALLLAILDHHLISKFVRSAWKGNAQMPVLAMKVRHLSLALTMSFKYSVALCVVYALLIIFCQTCYVVMFYMFALSITLAYGVWASAIFHDVRELFDRTVIRGDTTKGGIKGLMLRFYLLHACQGFVLMLFILIAKNGGRGMDMVSVTCDADVLN